jgi:hypothetical protein
VRGGLTEGQPGALDACGRARPADRSLTAVERDSGRAVPGHVGRHHGATAGVAVFERVGDVLVQISR